MTAWALPAQWQAAFQRDRQSAEVSAADPLPERRAARLLAAFILSGLAYLALPGTFLGVWNLIEIAAHRTAAGASSAWIQAHGHAQVFGWVGSFILGISLFILPKVRGAPLRSLRLGWLTWALWTAGVGWRWGCGVGLHGWRVGLPASAILELAALGLSQYLLFFPRRGRPNSGRRSRWSRLRSGFDGRQRRPTPLGASPSCRDSRRPRRRPKDLGSLLGIAGFGGLAAALIVNAMAAFRTAAANAIPQYPARLDRMTVELALWGFMLPLAWGYSTRFVTIFAGLRPPRQRAATVLGAGVMALIALLLAGQFALADSLAAILVGVAAWALRIFEPAAKPAKRLGVYRHFPAFIRLAYGWLAAGTALELAANFQPALGGAARHALTVGFVATLIFAIGPRILPAFLSSRELFSSRLMASSLWLLAVGCLARVASEAAAYSGAAGWAWKVLPASAFLELAAVLLFVANLALTLAHPPPAWFRPETMGGETPLYWYISSYPRTRRLLIAGGLKTLARTRAVPRSLTLAEAAAAEGLDVEVLVGQLHTFFRQRQPRRARA